MPEAALRSVATAVLETAPAPETAPVLPALCPVIPGGLRPGSVVGVDGPGAASLTLALIAGVSRDGGPEGTGGWCGVVGVPDFGVLAAAGMGAAPERLLLVDDPGERWPDVVAALVEAVDLVLLRPPERPGNAAVRRLSALARKRGCVLTLTGSFARDRPGIRLRLRMDEATWALRRVGAARVVGGRRWPGRGRHRVDGAVAGGRALVGSRTGSAEGPVPGRHRWRRLSARRGGRPMACGGVLRVTGRSADRVQIEARRITDESGDGVE